LALHSENANERIIYAFSGERQERFEGKLQNGATILTDDLRTLAFVKGHVQSVTDTSTKTEPVNWQRLKELPEELTVAYKDGYGNMKLSDSHANILLAVSRQPGFPRENIAGSRITLTLEVNGQERDIVLATGGSFSVKDGDFALSAGSSKPTGEQASAELFLRGGNAARALGIQYGTDIRSPQPGDTVGIRFKAIEKVEPGSEIDLGGVKITPGKPTARGVEK
jgi:hypothetical protein